MPKGVPNKRYTPEFKKLVIEVMMEEKLSYSETARRFEVNDHHRIQDWERIYLEEGPEAFAIERRGRGSKGRRQIIRAQARADAGRAQLQKRLYVSGVHRGVRHDIRLVQHRAADAANA